MRERAILVDDILAETYPDARCELDFSSPFELLVATVLSAQTTDVRVNEVTAQLFARYRDPASLAAAELDQLQQILRPLGFFRAKAASLTALSAILVSEHGGQVPGTLADLVALPGVGRKTANVVLGNAFSIPGITVDTHVGRLSRRLGYTEHTDPVKVERDLMALLPEDRWTGACHRLIFHGRRCCSARAPRCDACPVRRLCPRNGLD